MDLSHTIIESKRLVLVPISNNYSEQILLEYNESITSYMNHGPSKSIEEVEERIQAILVQMKTGKLLFMLVLLKESNEFLGCFALEDIGQNNPEMGGWIKESAHGLHYGYEAALALKTWADKNLNYEYILWPCASANTASRKLVELLGGKIQGEYIKTTASGKVLSYIDYFVYKTT